MRVAANLAHPLEATADRELLGWLREIGDAHQNDDRDGDWDAQDREVPAPYNKCGM
jgi:hypothetical protein